MTKQDSLIIKGIAILLMMIHHLFAFPDRIVMSSYIPLFYINNTSIEYYIGVFGAICVSIFIFISGYGLFISYKSKKIYKRIFKFYKNFFVIFIIFVSIGIRLGLIQISLKRIIGNLLMVSSSINGEWWFVQVYILLLIIYPLIHKIVLKYNSIVVLIISIFIYLFNYLLKFEVSIENLMISTAIGIVVGIIKVVIQNQIYLVIGCIFAKEMVFERIKKWIIKKGINSNISYIIFLILSIMISFTHYKIRYIIATPIFIFSCINIFENNKILLFLGKHSNNMWLIHTFFCYYYFQDIIFYPKYSILIVILLLIISLAISIIINLILDLIDNMWINLRNISNHKI